MTIKSTNPKEEIGETKLPLHLVSPIVKAYQAIAHYLGNIKYGRWNYRALGARASVYYSALNRHMDAWYEGEELDPADGTPHLANALACINILIEAAEGGNLQDDRPPSRKDQLIKLREKFEATMVSLNAKYGDKKPRHYTIADTPAPEWKDAEVQKPFKPYCLGEMNNPDPIKPFQVPVDGCQCYTCYCLRNG